MLPEIYGVRVYPVVLVGAVMASACLAMSGTSRQALPLGVWRASAAVAVLAAFALLGSKIWWLAEQSDSVAPLGALLFTVRGFRAPGGFLGVCVGTVMCGTLWGWESTGRLLDRIALPAALAMAVVRIGCLLEGCCFGAVSSVPWAIRFPATSHAWRSQVEARLIAGTPGEAMYPVHPLQAYFLLLALCVAASLKIARRRNLCSVPGSMFALFLAMHEGGKAILETWRGPAPRVDLQLGDATLALIGVIGLVLACARRPGRVASA